MSDSEMYPCEGSFVISNEQPVFPTFNDNIYLMMNGFNAVRIKGYTDNAKINIIFREYRSYSTELFRDDENVIDDTVIFQFSHNNWSIAFEGQVDSYQSLQWKANLTFRFVNLTEDEIDMLIDHGS